MNPIAKMHIVSQVLTNATYIIMPGDVLHSLFDFLNECLHFFLSSVYIVYKSSCAIGNMHLTESFAARAFFSSGRPCLQSYCFSLRTTRLRMHRSSCNRLSMR